MIPSWTAGAPIGSSVLYYPGGSLKNPKPAIVSECHQGGILTLVIVQFGTNGKADAARHKDDPFFKTFPHLLHRDGCWDYCEWNRPNIAMIPNPNYVQETAKPVDNRESNQKQRQPVGAR